MLNDMLSTLIPPEFQPAIANDVIYIQMDPEPAAAPGICTIVKDTMTSGRIFFDHRYIDNNDVRVLRLLCRGPNGIATPAEFPNHSMTYASTDPFRFAIFGVGQYVLPDIGQDLTATNVRATLNVLANLLQAQSMAARGFIRAHKILCGQIISVEVAGQADQTDWITSLFEMLKIHFLIAVKY